MAMGQKEKKSPSPKGETISILFIAGESQEVHFVNSILSAENNPAFTIKGVENFSNPLKNLADLQIDVALMDLGLLSPDRLAAISKVQDQNPSIPIVVMADSDEPGVRREALRRGAQEYLFKKQTDGKILSRVLTHAIERKQVEEALRQSEERSRSVIETANDAFVGMNTQGVIVDWNRQAELTFGWSRLEAIGRTVAEVMIPAKFREKHHQGIRHFLDTGEGPVFNRRIELSALHKDGHEFPVELTVWPVHYDEKVYFYAFIHDISERKRLEQLKDEFVNTVSHELRTPMTIVREGVLQVLEGLHGEISEEQKKFLFMTLHNVDRLKRIIESLLDISKIESGHLPLERQRVDLVDLTKELILAFHSAAENKGLKILEKHSGHSILAYVDKGKIAQVLTNLIGNAVKFTDQGKIEIILQEERESVECTISDTGPGIAQEDLPKVFNKFEQFGRLAGPGEKGTGLGLAISKGLVEAHKGKIWVISRLGQGTKFTFTIPKYSAREVLEEYLTSALPAAVRQKNSLSILIFRVADFDSVLGRLGQDKMSAIIQEMGGRIRGGLRQHIDSVLEHSDRIWAGLPSTSAKGARVVSERIERILQQWLKEKKLEGQLQIETGVVTFPDDGQTVQELIQRIT